MHLSMADMAAAHGMSVPLYLFLGSVGIAAWLCLVFGSIALLVWSAKVFAWAVRQLADAEQKSEAPRTGPAAPGAAPRALPDGNHGENNR
jgi:hypothetical protein